MNKASPLALLVAAASASAAGLNATDTGFLARAVRGNNFEIEAARLALRMSRSETNRAFARQMIDDHTRLGAQVKAAAAQAGPRMKLPMTVTYKQ